MIVFLLVPWLLGVLLVYRLLKIDSLLEALPVGWGAGWLYTLMMVNFGLLGGLSLERALALALSLGGALSLLMLGLGDRVRWVRPQLSWGGWLFLALGSLTVYLTTNTILYLNPDDDFFLHAPLQSQLSKSDFPIINPFLPDISYGGHYARDLLVVVVARLSGATLYGVQAPVTTSLQLCAFLILFTALRRATGSLSQAALGTASVFAGANAGFRGGWLDTVANNNALAQTICALLFVFVVEALFTRPRGGATLLSGLTLGGLAWAYETNFTVMALGLCGLAFSTLLLRKLTLAQLKTAALIVAIALPLAVVQGGIFKHLLDKFRGGHEIGATQADETLQSQNLEVSVKFPKDELFEIKLDRSGEEMSMAYSTLPLLRDLTKSGGTPGYVSVFSWYAIRIHWLALYLAPLSLGLLLKRANWAGLLLWWVGFSGYFLPSVVNFGLWEAEVFRWQFVAAWGFAGGLGIALAQWWERLPGPLAVVERHAFELRSKGLALLVLALLLGLNFYPSYHQARQRTAQLDRLASAVLFPSAADWFERQPELDLAPADLGAGLWLGGQARRRETLLTNSREENEHNIMFNSSFLGLSGLRPVGHTLPLPFERLGTRPFRATAAARAFWATFDPDLLRALAPDWLYLRGQPAELLTGREGLELAFRQDDLHSVFRVKVEPLRAGPDAPAGLALKTLTLPSDLETEQVVSATATLVGGGTANLDTTLSYELSDAEGKPVEAWERFLQPVRLRGGGDGPTTVRFHLVAPHLEGSYRLRLRVGSELLPGEANLAVGTRARLWGMKLVSARPLDPLVPGQVARFQLRLRNDRSSVVRTSAELLAALLPVVEGRSLHEARDFQTLRLEIPAGAEREIELPVVVPEVTNGFEMMLLPRDGWGIWTLPASDPTP